MKYLRMTLLLGLAMIIQPVIADDDHSLISPDSQNYIAYGVIVAMLLLFILVMLVILKAVKVLTRVILKSQGYTEEQIAADLSPTKKGKSRKVKYGTSSFH